MPDKLNYYYKSRDEYFNLIFDDCIRALKKIDIKADMIFADPPYFLSNGGISVQSGKMVCVDKGDWDKSKGFNKDNNFNYRWLYECRRVLKPSGTIWVCGTFHNIFSVAQNLFRLDFKILNCIIWQKTNPPPNLSCKYFTHSYEMIIWARKEKRISHYFNYDLMYKINNNKQMRDIWTISAISSSEKRFGKHPTQKPLALLERIILASTKEKELILDPFTGSSTTGIAASLLGRKFLGIDNNKAFLDLSIKRFEGR